MDQWQDAVNSFRVDFDCDIYVTGSNAYLLSSEYATYLAGRSVEIKMLPLSFSEFLDFHGYTVRERKNPSGGISKRIFDADGESYDPKDLLEAYLKTQDGIRIVMLADFLLGGYSLKITGGDRMRY